jgi:hypothetical protein
MLLTSSVLAFGFWLWAALIAYFGFATILSCEAANCSAGLPWLEPWRWSQHYAFPEAFILGIAGLVAASVFALGVATRRLVLAEVALAVALPILVFTGVAVFEGGLLALVPIGAALGVGSLFAAHRREVELS